MSKFLSEEELRVLAENSYIDDPYHDSDDSKDEDYRGNSSDESSSSSSKQEEDKTLNDENNENEDDNFSDEAESQESEVEVRSGKDEEESEEPDCANNNNNNNDSNAMRNLNILWSRKIDNFAPKKQIPSERSSVILCNIDSNSTVLDIVMKLIPKSLFIYIAQCTNQRLYLLQKNNKKKTNIEETNWAEIMTVLGCTLVMSYNKLPAFHMYWSQNKSLGNALIKSVISRDRCQLLLSKLYFNNPEKPDNASKLYYIEEIINCFKKTFPAARSESSFQSIDETMTKFKGRSSLKQYLPMKPIKRGIKLWTRCDSITDYIYDTNVYAGKDTEIQDGTLGERVVLKLLETVRDPDVAFCFDRFFTSVNLINTIPYAAVGTCIKNRKNVPKFGASLSRGQSEAVVCPEGLVACRWQDSKEVLVLSNCHDVNVSSVQRKMKDGTKSTFDCPEAIVFYNKYMGGVDHADQMVSLYDLDRKSMKWWRKVFYKLFMEAIFNAYVINCEINKKIPFIEFLIDVATQMMTRGKENNGKKRRMSRGRPTKRTKTMINTGNHLPVKGKSRRRCAQCAMKKIEKRTNLLCQECQMPLCVDCFALYHS